jgi:hypothetical protein
MMRMLLCGLVAFLFLWATPVWAGGLSDRIAAYPDWHRKPETKSQFEEVSYPTWMGGTWHCKSTLVEMIAPFADQKITTPGFEGNRNYLNQPVTFDVKFGASTVKPQGSFGLPNMSLIQKPQPKIVVDRIFNALSISNAYLGEGVVESIRINAQKPQEQLTTLKDGLQLLSITTGHNTDRPSELQFITTEVFQQIFRGSDNPYLNQVETTTNYQYQSSNNSADYQPESTSTHGVKSDRNEVPKIVADQYTAIYLSPRDPNYFTAAETPVALYRYRLELTPAF